ncbi:MAG: hypothetical protein QM775_09585 [Pirellulales bacterium]
MASHNPINSANQHSNVTQASNLGRTRELSEASQGVPPPGTPKEIGFDGADEIFRRLKELREKRVEKLLRNIKGDSLQERLVDILRKASMSVQTSGFEDADVQRRLSESMKTMMDRGQPILLGLLMGGGKVPVPLKTGYAILPDVAEWVSWSNLAAIAQAFEAIYPAGAIVAPIPDVALHTADLGMAVDEAIIHQRQAQDDLHAIGIERYVKIVDVLSVLPTEWPTDVDRLAKEAIEKIANEIQEREKFAAQVDSLLYSVNTRVKSWPCTRLIEIYTAISAIQNHGAKIDDDDARQLIRHVTAITPHYTAVNWAIREHDLVGRVAAVLTGSRRHIRMSVHAKYGEPRPKLFGDHGPVRSHGLLPMHGVGIVERSKHGLQFGVDFELAARIGRWPPVRINGRQVGYEIQGNDVERADGKSSDRSLRLATEFGHKQLKTEACFLGRGRVLAAIK